MQSIPPLTLIPVEWGGGFRPFPDYILVGQINLHKSQECAASLVRHIDKRWDYFRINRNGILSSAQVELNRDPNRYGAHKDGKPLSVTEWKAQEKIKLTEARRQQSQEELVASSAVPSSYGAGNGTRKRSGSRSRRTSRGRTRRLTSSRTSRRGRGRAGSNTPNESVSAGTSSAAAADSHSRSKARRSRSGGRRRSRNGRSGGRSRGRSTTAGKANCQPKTATVRVPQKGPLNVKTPRLAKRNLRDKGQLPRRRGPDKINLDKSNSSIDSDSLPEISDEFAPEAITLPQLDGFMSDISTSDGAPSTIDDEINNSTIHYAQSNPMDEIEVPNSSEFRPNLASTQNGEENQDGSTPSNINMPHLDAWLRGIRNAPPIDGSTPPDPDRQHSQSSNSPDPPATGSGEAGNPVPTPLGESWVGPPLSRNEAEAQRPSANLSKNIWDKQMQEYEDKFGVSPSAFLYALQEPCVFLQRVVNISGATVIMDPEADTVRAAIVCSTHLNVWPAPEFCTGDMVTCILKTKKHGEIYVVSLYCDGDEQPIPDKLKLLHGKARREGKELLVLGDLNAHSSALWNSKKTDARGVAWENFVFDKGLRVLNRGDKFTFIGPTGQSIIDVNMATPKVADMVQH